MSWAHHVHSVVRQLADVIRPSFGPLGRDQLLQSPSTLLVTNSSSTILTALVASQHFLPDSAPASHRAIASVVLNQLHRCVEQHGDGSGAILLMLEAAMHDIVSWLRERGVGDVEDDSVRGNAQYVKAIHTLLRSQQAVEREWLATDQDRRVAESVLMAEMRSVGRPIEEDLAAQLDAFQQLLHTQLGQLQLTRPFNSPFVHSLPLPLSVQCTHFLCRGCVLFECSWQVWWQRGECAATCHSRLHQQLSQAWLQHQ